MKFSLNKSFVAISEPTERTILLSESFGLGLDAKREFPIFENIELDLRPSDVVYVCGDSGSGKSILLRMLAERISQIPLFGRVADLSKIEVSPSDVLIDCAGPTFDAALKNLCLSGLEKSEDELDDR